MPARSTKVQAMSENTRFLFVPETSVGKGSGHLLRCIKIAAHLDQVSFLIAGSDQQRLVSAFPLLKRFDLVSSIQEAFEATDYSKPAWIVFDKPLLGKSEVDQAKHHAAVIAFDGRGVGAGAASYIIDILPRLQVKRFLTWSPQSCQPSNQTSSAFAKKSSINVLISFGGEDPGGLRNALLANRSFLTLTQSCQLDFVRGALSPALPAKLSANCREIGPFESLEALWKDYDLVITSFGLTAYEALAAAKRVLVFNPANYHQKLSLQEGFDSLGVLRLNNTSLALLRSTLHQVSFLKQKQHGQSAEDSSTWSQLAKRLTSLENPNGHCCPACQSSQGSAIGRFEDKTFFVCSNCDMYYLHLIGAQTIEYQEDYFFSEYAKQYGKTYLDDFDYIQSLGKLRLKRISTMRKEKNGTLLDIGCAYGPFLIAAKQAGFEVKGCDISQDAVNHVTQKLGLAAVSGDIRLMNTQSLGGPYDVLSMWYVIEHFPDLYRVLAILSAMVKKDGILALATPSAQGVSAQLRWGDFLAQSPRDHYTLWRPRRIKKLLAWHGFRLIKICSTGHHPERFKGILAKPLFFPLTRLISRIFSLGDTFEVYARQTKDNNQGVGG